MITEYSASFATPQIMKHSTSKGQYPGLGWWMANNIDITQASGNDNIQQEKIQLSFPDIHWQYCYWTYILLSILSGLPLTRKWTGVILYTMQLQEQVRLGFLWRELTPIAPKHCPPAIRFISEMWQNTHNLPGWVQSITHSTTNCTVAAVCTGCNTATPQDFLNNTFQTRTLIC